MNESLEVLEDQLRERLLTSLKVLTLNHNFHTPYGDLIADAVAALKINGILQHLDMILMKFAPPVGVRTLGLPPLSLGQIKSAIEKQLGPILLEAKLKLEFEEAS